MNLGNPSSSIQLFTNLRKCKTQSPVNEFKLLDLVHALNFYASSWIRVSCISRNRKEVVEREKNEVCYTDSSKVCFPSALTQSRISLSSVRSVPDNPPACFKDCKWLLISKSVRRKKIFLQRIIIFYLSNNESLGELWYIRFILVDLLVLERY